MNAIVEFEKRAIPSETRFTFYFFTCAVFRNVQTSNTEQDAATHTCRLRPTENNMEK